MTKEGGRSDAPPALSGLVAAAAADRQRRVWRPRRARRPRGDRGPHRLAASGQAASPLAEAVLLVVARERVRLRGLDRSHSGDRAGASGTQHGERDAGEVTGAPDLPAEAAAYSRRRGIRERLGGASRGR